jgi:hypothetical protein
MRVYAKTVILAVTFALSLGLAGLAAGYFGNAVLAANPGNMAPVLGILVTGPRAAAAGALLGLLCGVAGVRRSAILATFAIALAVTVLLSMAVVAPGFQPEARIVKAKITACAPAESLVRTRISYWRAESARVTRERLVDVRPDWEASVSQMLKARPGVLLFLAPEQSRWVSRRRWSWGRTNWRLERVTNDMQAESTFMDASDCQQTGIAPDAPANLCMCWEASEGFPPSGLPEFLGKWVVHRIPANLETSPDLFGWVQRTCGHGSAG